MSTPTADPRQHLAELRQRLDAVMLRDRRRLERQLDRRDVDLERAARDVDAAEARVAARRRSVPAITYPEQLPVSQRKDDIAAAIRDHQVVVVAGETGSGKTTQLPKVLLELGRGVTGLIGHTQPRRIAARTVAERIASELGTELGQVVGYKVRFTDQSSDSTLVKVMTDGILLAEMQNDRLLAAYDTIVVDEAHERSLNIDFLLGYLKQLLPQRPDLKLVITSATIDPLRFSEHFGGAPVVEVSGRTFPVELRYRPPADDVDQAQAICDAVAELAEEGPGDVLVFLSGEREIRDTADALRHTVDDRTEVLPLYARLSAAEQHRVFAPHTGRRVVLATNVAETSLTVPGIRYVVDPGTARISRYSQRTKVQRLPIEAISQASAQQRSGRCGRVAPGIAVRLYSEEDFDSRPEFTEPEVLRTNLASVILQMTALGLGDVERFPFVEPPDRRSVRDGVQLLHELGALDDRGLTAVGRRLAQLPVDPRLGRMVLEADRNGCLREVLVLAAALSVQDPRERPQERQQEAAELHRRFADEHSDFTAFLNLWEHVREGQALLGSSAFRRLCREELLNHLRIREWQDVHSQLRQVTRSLGMRPNLEPAPANNVHQSLLAGLLSHVGLREGETRDFLGARGARFAVVPGSSLAKKPPRWVVVAELVETNRLWGRVAARVEPEWVEALAGHLVTRTYSEPHWSSKRSAAMAYERVTLYGVPLVAKRAVTYSSIDPETSRDLFIRRALVEGDWRTHHAFFEANRRLLDDVEDLEARARRRDLVVDDQVLYDFYDARLPAEVTSGRHFDAWWKTARRADPQLLDLDVADLLSDGADAVTRDDYPDRWGELGLLLTYQFTPGEAADGVTVHIPVAVLNQVRPDGFDWLVPGLRQDLVTALVKALPKPLRVRLVPAPDTARAVLARLSPADGPLLPVLARELGHLARERVEPSDFQLDRVPAHLRMTFRVFSGDQTLGEGKDLAALQTRLAPRLQQAISTAAVGLERRGLRTWDVGDLEREVVQGAVRGYPALVDAGDSVALSVLGSREQAEQAHAAGVRRMLLLALPDPVKGVAGRLTNAQKLALSRAPHGTVPALLQDCATAAVDRLVAAHGGPPRTEAAYAALLAAVRDALPTAVAQLVTAVEKVLATSYDVQAGLAAETRPALAPAVQDLREQLAELVRPGFVTALGADRVPDLARWLRGMRVRLDKLPRDPVRDRAAQDRVALVRAEWERMPEGPAKREVRWMLEELRLSLFAQEVRTRHPVSEKRIYAVMDAAEGR